jgi:hypothetical protein
MRPLSDALLHDSVIETNLQIREGAIASSPNIEDIVGAPNERAYWLGSRWLGSR